MDIMEQLRPVLTDMAVIIITGLLTAAVARFQAWTGVQIEAKHREALQSALSNGAAIAATAGIDAGVAYVERSVPDALRHLGAVTSARVRELLEPHIARLKTAA